MVRATRKNKETSEIVEEKVSKKPKLDRKRKNNDDNDDDDKIAMDVTELARERHAEWAKLVLGKTYLLSHLFIHSYLSLVHLPFIIFYSTY